jgi:hypothetical protein
MNLAPRYSAYAEICHGPGEFTPLDLQSMSHFYSVYRKKEEEIAHTRNNWLCYDFKDRRIIPSHYSIRTNYGPANWQHLQNWVVEVSDRGEKWSEIDGRENNSELNGEAF